MMLMTQEINRALDSLPARPTRLLQVTCGTCHRGTTPDSAGLAAARDGASRGSDSAIRAYRALRERYYGRDAFNFGEPSLNIAAFRLGQARKFDEALALLRPE